MHCQRRWRGKVGVEKSIRAWGNSWGVSTLESGWSLLCGSDLPSRKAYGLQMSTSAGVPELQSHVLPRARSHPSSGKVASFLGAIHPVTSQEGVYRPGHINPMGADTRLGPDLSLAETLSSCISAQLLPLSTPASFHRCGP